MEDLTYNDGALLIDTKHFISNWELDNEVKKLTENKLIQFRVIQNYKRLSSHGWIDNSEIVQWG